MNVRFIPLAALFLIVGLGPHIGCGSESTSDKGPVQGTSDPAFEQIKPLIAKNCGVCHDGVKQSPKFDTGAKFKKAKARLTAGTMPPPPRKLSEDDRAALLGYINGG